AQLKLAFFNHPEGYVSPKNASDISQGFKYVYQYKDHLGNVRLSYTDQDKDGVITPSTEIIEESNYYPFGLEHKGYNNVVNGTEHPYTYNGKEKQEELGLNWMDYGARNYDASLGRWMSIDDLSEMQYEYSPYHYTYNNPISFNDPTGMIGESTHTDIDGNVIAVYDDGDLGVYKHKDAKTKADVDKKRAGKGKGEADKKGKKGDKPTTSGGGEKMGETAHWDEFISPETGKTMTNYKIQFGKSFDPIIDDMAKKADDMDLKEIASKSGPKGLFDIKNDYKNVAGLLNGKYATSRSAGNYLAGYNAEGGTYFGISISFTTFQKLAGALHVKGGLTTSQKAGIVIKGTSYGPAPTYGEVNYQYRMSKSGWNQSKKDNN
ncbi:RHS repeat domain-containing protein, partial [Tenacibaculum maritimum]